MSSSSNGPAAVPGPESAAELAHVAAEIEAHVASTGWDRPPVLFALVRADQLRVGEPELAQRMGLDTGDALTPVEQDELPEGPLDDALGRIAWPAAVSGCAVSQEIVLLPPGAEATATSTDPDLSAAVVAAHPDRREARLVAAVLRDGTSAVVLRLRTADYGEPEPGADDLLTGPDLAPNLVAALHATLE